MHRWGFSVLGRRAAPFGGDWSTGLVIGGNVHHHTGPDHAAAHGDPNASPHHRSSALLLETNLDLGTRNTIFGRAETVQKSAEELGFLGGDLTELFDVQSLLGGYVRHLGDVSGAEIGLGALASIGFVPSALEPTYGTQSPKGFAVFFRIRPRVATGMRMSGM
jgi:hypothetical protein